MHTQDADREQEMEKLVGVIFYYVLIRMFLKEKNMLCTMSCFPCCPTLSYLFLSGDRFRIPSSYAGM